LTRAAGLAPAVFGWGDSGRPVPGSSGNNTAPVTSHRAGANRSCYDRARAVFASKSAPQRRLPADESPQEGVSGGPTRGEGWLRGARLCGKRRFVRGPLIDIGYNTAPGPRDRAAWLQIGKVAQFAGVLCILWRWGVGALKPAKMAVARLSGVLVR